MTIALSGKNIMDGESKEQREERLRLLWKKLDVKRQGSLDMAALKSGLAQMNHREQPAYSSRVSLYYFADTRVFSAQRCRWPDPRYALGLRHQSRRADNI